MKKSKTKLKINSSKNFGITDDKIKHFKETFDDMDRGSDRFTETPYQQKPPVMTTNKIELNKTDIHFMFAIVANDKAGQIIHLFKQQKKAEEFLVKLKEW